MARGVIWLVHFVALNLTLKSIVDVLQNYIGLLLFSNGIDNPASDRVLQLV